MDAEALKSHRVLAVLCQLWCFLGPLLFLSIILRLVRLDRGDPLLRATVTDVLNLQVVALMALIPGVILAVLGFSFLALVFWSIWCVAIGYGYVVGAIGAVRSWRGEVWTYPINLHLVGGRVASRRPDNEQ